MPNGDNGQQGEIGPSDAIVVATKAFDRKRVVYVETAPLDRQPEDDPAFPT